MGFIHYFCCMIAVVTGATKGIGRAIAERLAAEGFDLIITARSQADLHVRKKQWEETFGIQVFMKPADFARKADVILFGEFVKTHAPNGVDILVNNIGRYQQGNLFEQPYEVLEEQFRVNFFSAHLLTSVLQETFMARRQGHIFTLCSSVSKYPRKYAAFYSLAKITLRAWSHQLLEEMRPHGVRVTALLPGSTWSDSWKESPASPDELIHPEDVAQALFDCYKMRNTATVEEILIRNSNPKWE